MQKYNEGTGSKANCLLRQNKKRSIFLKSDYPLIKLKQADSNAKFESACFASLRVYKIFKKNHYHKVKCVLKTEKIIKDFS